MARAKVAVFGGTTQGRIITERLCREDMDVVMYVATQLGVDHFQKKHSGYPFDEEGVGMLDISTGPLGGAAMKDSLAAHGFAAVIDATHPFAEEVSAHLSAVTALLSMPLLVIRREETVVPDGAVVHRVADFEEAAEVAHKLGERVFLTIGSRRLPEFVSSFPGEIERLVVRILDDARSVESCAGVGIDPGSIVLGTGPFTQEVNREHLTRHGADVLVTKDSGPSGGTGEKISVCMSLGLPVVLIDRPSVGGLSVTGVGQAVEWTKGVISGG